MDKQQAIETLFSYEVSTAYMVNAYGSALTEGSPKEGLWKRIRNIEATTLALSLELAKDTPDMEYVQGGLSFIYYVLGTYHRPGPFTLYDYEIVLPGGEGLDFFLIKGKKGDDGWTPVLANVPVSELKTVQQVVDWIGGEGEKPETGMYISPTGFTTDINLATNIKGDPGAAIDDGTVSGSTTWSSQKITNELGQYIPKSYLDTDPDMTANSDERISTQRATKTAIARQKDAWVLREW